jgi:hypothetical protein
MSSISSVSSSVSLPSAQASGVSALRTSSEQLSLAAQQIADPGNQNLINPLLDAKQSGLMADAGAAVIKASNQMLGALLDIFA